MSNNKTGLTIDILKELLNTKSINEVAKMYNCTYSNIRNRAKKNNIEYKKVDRTEIRMPKKYKYDEGFFKVIDTQEKAYWLGFIMADGCIVQKSKNKPSLSLIINLKQSDSSHLGKFNKALNGDLPIRFFKQPPVTINAQSGIVNLGTRDGCKIDVNSKWLCLDLINHNVGQRKTLNEQIPIIEDERLIRHFIRGFFDGDGCFSAVKPKNRKREYAKIFIASGEIIIDYIIDNVFRATGVLMSKDTYGKLYRCYIQRENSIIKVLEWLYKDSIIHLDRKKELIDSYLSKYSLNAI